MIRLPFFTPRIRTPSAVYHFLIDRKPVAVSELIGKPNSLLEYYLQIDDLTCCSILGGFTVSADGKVVMDVIDEVSMSQSWLPAIINLQRGSQYEAVWAWEESHLTLTRKDSILEMKDVHHSGKVVCPKTTFRFRDFVVAFLDASRPMALFVEQFYSHGYS